MNINLSAAYLYRKPGAEPVIFHLPRDIRSANAMRSAINERALRNGSRESDRVRAVCEGLRYMVLGSSSSAAVQLGWQTLGGRGPSIPGYGDGGRAA